MHAEGSTGTAPVGSRATIRRSERAKERHDLPQLCLGQRVRSHRRAWNAEANDPVYRPISFAILDGSTSQGRTAEVAGAVWRLPCRTLVAKRHSTGLMISRTG